MKTDTLFQRTPRYLILSLLALLLLPGCAQSQTYSTSAHEELYAPYSRQELAQMVAPVALYPDALLAQVLMASTYPIEIVEAERWVRTNPSLKNDALDAALLRQNWDPSVKALTHFPSILTLMSERISETTELGNAFLAQEADVMVMVQELRAQAYAHGNLKSDDRQRVIVDTQTIIIQPVNPRVVYVPYYDSLHVYGSWWYPAYPPRYWGPPGVRISYIGGYWPGFYFNFSYGNWSYFDWQRRVIFVEAHTRPRFVQRERWVTRTDTWKHAPSHRRGVAYRDHTTSSRFSVPNRKGSTNRQYQTRPRVVRQDAATAPPGARITPQTGRQYDTRPSRPTVERRTPQRNEGQTNERRGSAEYRRQQQETSVTHQPSPPPQWQPAQQTNRDGRGQRQQTAESWSEQSRIQHNQQVRTEVSTRRPHRQETLESRLQQPRGQEQNRQLRTTQRPERQEVTRTTENTNRELRTGAGRQEHLRERTMPRRDQRTSEDHERSRNGRTGGWR